MTRVELEQESHDKAVLEIARLKFPFPSTDYPDWKTFSNPNAQQNMGVKRNEETVFPDIVVVDQKAKTVAMVGEVETSSTVTEDHADQWKNYSSICNSFFLYVPKDCGPEAKRILDLKKISYSGLRTYGFDSQGNISIVNA